MKAFYHQLLSLLDGFLSQTQHGVALLLFVVDAPAQLSLHGARTRDCHAVQTSLQGHLDIVLGPQELTVGIPTPVDQQEEVEV